MLSIVAEHADVETIHILAASHPMKIAYDLNAESLAASLEALQQRRDYSEDLSEAFQELIAIVEAEEAECQSIDSLVESGLFLSAKSTFHEEIAEALAKLDSAAVSPTTTDFEDCTEDLISL
jgi:hypothetical protein